MSANEEMNRRIFEAAGRSRVRIAAAIPEPNSVMNSLLLAATGRAPVEPHPSEAISDEADAFTRESALQGIPADLVDAARAVIPNADQLSGAALRSAMTKAIEERPSLRAAESRIPQAPDGLDGGAGRGSSREDASPSMTDMILVAAGRKASTYLASNGIVIERGT